MKDCLFFLFIFCYYCTNLPLCQGRSYNVTGKPRHLAQSFLSFIVIINVLNTLEGNLTMEIVSAGHRLSGYGPVCLEQLVVRLSALFYERS